MANTTIVSESSKAVIGDFYGVATEAGFRGDQIKTLLGEGAENPTQLLTPPQAKKLDNLRYIVRNWRAAAREDQNFQTIGQWLDFEGNPFGMDLVLDEKRGARALMLRDPERGIATIRAGVRYSLSC